MAQQQLGSYDPAGIEAFVNHQPPIPGQSLTSSPEEIRPFEGQPEYTNFTEALDDTVSELLKEEVFMPLMKAINSGMPLTDIALNILYTGFREGKWNPDLLMMLIEPLIFVLMALSEKSGIEYRITGDEEDDLDEEESSVMTETRAKHLNSIVNKKTGQLSSVPQGAIPSEIMEQIQSIEVPESLLQRTEQSQEETLLGRTE